PSTDRRPNPLTNLPTWHWPLGKPDESARNHKLDQLLPANPDVTTDREHTLNRLANSLVSFSGEEGRRGILSAYPSMSQGQVDGLLKVLEEAQKYFESLVEQSPDGVFNQFHQRFPEWAGIVLDDETAGWRRYLYAPLEGETLFAHAESWPHYWLGLAQGLMVRMGDQQAAERALERAKKRADPSELANLAERLLEPERPEETPEETWRWLEEQARRLAPDHDWLDFLIARRLLQAPEPDPDRAGQLLTPLLDNPPAAHHCNDLAVLILDKLPKLAAKTEPLLRRAIVLAPQDAHPWNNLGALLMQHLGRYEEAEAAFRQAIELDPKYALPWNNLGILLKNHLDRHQEAEAAYRQAIELNPKDADPWYNLGILLKNHLDRHEEAEAAYRQAIGLAPQDAHPWNELGLLHRTWQRDCEEAFRCFTEALARAAPDSLIAAYSRMNLGRLELIRGRPEETRRELGQALHLFDRQAGFQPYALWLAVALAEPASAENDPPLARSHAPAWERKGGRSSGQGFTTLERRGLAPTLERGSQTETGTDPDGTSIADLVERHTQKAKETLAKTQDPASEAARYLFIASLAAGAVDEALWRGIRSGLTTHEDRFDLIDALYLLAGLRPDLAPAAAQRVADLLALPAEQTDQFRDRPKPPDWLERYRPFAEGRSRGASDRPRFCRDTPQ
ncbi:MAG: tetratricopeptide repeat protein, partial [Candidatus Thiosymbion ectosymbiont of Robbea hypermnestra]|nr:tetratricopeptide repeat protein [Candidatus Thiosymbion ectosymbiont of Robbea hypermnestra]